ncbi:MAG: hypothetical protein CMJ65_10220 [Planctomycetaceae bacterium]|nr:hypothetical protein [Planctomycetaceae bacterium]
MSELFDPYHKWLGIPADQQPVDHYRLLGVAQFESDPDVIEAAANQRTSYLRDKSSGEHVKLAEQLSNEILLARRCLLNQEQKQEYDEQLQQRQPAAAKSSTRPTWLIVGSIASLALVAGMLVALVRNGGTDNAATATGGMLVFRWGLDERTGASLQVDGKAHDLPEKPEFEVALERQPRHRHHIVIQRQGFKSIDRRMLVAPGDRVIVQPNWQKSGRRRP